MRKVLLALFSIFIIFTSGACIYAQQLQQQKFQLQFPVKCQINKDCWIVNYVDDDPSTNWHDYKNSRETYDGHTGTDIAIKDISQMKEGVDVIAAADGVVVATRDGVPDKNALSQDLSKLQDIGCGNRVAIKHTEGWITDYCHMKKGSIKVKKGDVIIAGQKLGEIGMSGLTEFPHLHINVQQNNLFIDPFTGLERYKTGPIVPLWNPQVLQQLTYKPVVLYNAGVSDRIPSLLEIRDEKFKNTQMSSEAYMIILWIDAFHVEANDSIDVLVKAPNGIPFIKRNIVIDKPNAKKLLYLGRRPDDDSNFAKGVYYVQISFKRPNTNITDYKSFSFSVH